MSSGDLSTPSATVTAGSKLEMEIQDASEALRRMFLPEDDDDDIKKYLNTAWFYVHDALLRGGDSKLKERLKNESEFRAHVRPGSNGERSLLTLVRSMAKRQVPRRNLFEHGTFLSSF
jgi:hypothetical protein